jgi:hypothetical protein
MAHNLAVCLLGRPCSGPRARPVEADRLTCRAFDGPPLFVRWPCCPSIPSESFVPTPLCARCVAGGVAESGRSVACIQLRHFDPIATLARPVTTLARPVETLVPACAHGRIRHQHPMVAPIGDRPPWQQATLRATPTILGPDRASESDRGVAGEIGSSVPAPSAARSAGVVSLRCLRGTPAAARC